MTFVLYFLRNKYPIAVHKYFENVAERLARFVNKIRPFVRIWRFIARARLKELERRAGKRV